MKTGLNFFKLSVLLAGLFASASSMAAIDSIYTGRFNNNAIQGYDAVAYFTEGKPVKGDKSHSFEYLEANWSFSSAENLEMFKADPEAYAPQYGGYCAYAMANGNTASAEADLWTIIDGKLYMNYSRKVMKTWLEDTAAYVVKADEVWPTLEKE